MPMLFPILGAVLLHAFVFWVPLSQHLPSERAKRAPQDNIVVERWEDTEPKQSVQTSRAQEQEEGGKARFGGEFRNRVKKETRSPVVGQVREGPQVGNSFPDDDGHGLTLSDLLPYGSQSDVLPDDVEIGGQTLLNTDPFLYSSFMNRVHDEVHGPWSRRVQGVARTMEDRLREKTYVTKLLVSVDGDGHVVSIRTMQSCGIPEIDDAAKEAIWESEPFPDPPKNYKDLAETLSLPYEFHVSVTDASFLMMPWRL
ncbi:MAG: TonB family protein [Bdellovibrionales bacterium]|nr:TonB family protein [Bdellovibrionales bacterium]